MESRRSESGPAGLAPLFGVAIATAALTWFALEFRGRLFEPGGAATEAAALRLEVAALARRVAALEAEHRTLASLAAMRAEGESRPAGEPPVRAAPAAAATLASKPIEDAGAAIERARTGADDLVARAIERAAALPRLEASPAAAEAGSPAAPESAGLDAAGPAPEAQPEPRKPDAEAVIAAFNQLLGDGGLSEWRLLSAEPRPEDKALGSVVFAHRAPRGPAIGSLSAERLVLERDPVSGVASVKLTGAKGFESGVEVAFENGTTELEIPGILPLELLAPALREIFAISEGGAPDSGARTADQVVRAVNGVLAEEKSVALRLRSVDRIEDGTLRKAVIDLAFDEQGTPTQTVVAESAWFELDPSARHGELVCEGGEMVEKGLKRPLFRGKLRVPLRDLKPERWKGVPATRLSAGS
jgi:hypothetical protein